MLNGRCTVRPRTPPVEFLLLRGNGNLTVHQCSRPLEDRTCVCSPTNREELRPDQRRISHKNCGVVDGSIVEQVLGSAAHSPHSDVLAYASGGEKGPRTSFVRIRNPYYRGLMGRDFLWLTRPLVESLLRRVFYSTKAEPFMRIPDE